MIFNVLRRIEQENQKNPAWIVGPATGRMLYWLVRVLGPEVALEIGTSVGYSALWMAAALEANKKGRLWTIESHEERFKQAKKNIEEAGLAGRVMQIRGHAPEVFLRDFPIPEQVDLAFFDATKQEHQDYFDAVFPRMRCGGMIIVDNAVSHRQGQMKKFIEKTHANTGLKVVEIPVGSGLLIARVV